MKKKNGFWLYSLIVIGIILIINNSCKKEEEKRVPILTTSVASSITTTTATIGGNVTSDGGSTITERGVCYSTQTPTIASNKVTAFGTIGTFTSNLTGLTANIKYYVRAYATNSAGTAYGNEVAFKTLDGAITLTTKAATSITATSATSGGNITSDGGALITASGLVWSTSQNPTITSNQGITSNGTGTGSFISNITNLQPQTNYYVRAYATNSLGTSYGNEQTFTTLIADGQGGTITDVDGNIYNTIWINGRQWMKENLKTTKYSNGINIPNVTDNGTWAGLSTPAYCWYNNDLTTYGNTYGGLYNWYSVNTGNLCPTSWHVPTDAEWYAMENYVDQTINIPNVMDFRGTDGGTKLKATSGWFSNGHGTDIYGFSALPGGFRSLNSGEFISVGYDGYWWSRTEYDATFSYMRNMRNGYGSVRREGAFKKDGYSVRCVRD